MHTTHAYIHNICARTQLQHVQTLKLKNTIVCILYTISAGVGRSGAFCAISTAIERVKAEETVDIFHGVKHLHTQHGPNIGKNECYCTITYGSAYW